MANSGTRGVLLRWLVLCAVVLGAAAEPEELSFRTRRDFDLGDPPTGVAVADLNGDGVPDVVASINSGVAVLLGNGDGAFQPARRFETPRYATAVAVADFNGDGVPDLAISSSMGAVSVLLGNGDGTFQEARNFEAGKYSDALAVGDFNGDGFLDIAVANFWSHYVALLFGNGDGTFQPAEQLAVGNGSNSIAAGDFDGDGRLDLAVSVPYDGTVLVLLGNGDGTFQAPRSLPAGLYPRWVAVGDFNADGRLDLAVAGGVRVFLGNGDGTFQAAVSYLADASFIAVSDVDGDGAEDIVAASGLFAESVSVLFGNGDGTFQPERKFRVGQGAVAVAAADLRGGGLKDLIAANAYSETISVLPALPERTFLDLPHSERAPAPAFIAIADFDGDGVLDFAVCGDGSGQSFTVSVFFGLGDGVFGPPLELNTPHWAHAVATGDFNGDGAPDLVTAYRTIGPDHGGLSVRLGNGDRTFQEPLDIDLGSQTTDIAVGDFNGDGALDLAVSHYWYISILLGNGDGTFHFQRIVDTGTAPAQSPWAISMATA